MATSRQKKRRKSLLVFLYYIVCILLLSEVLYLAAVDTALEAPRYELTLSGDGYADGGTSSVFGKLLHRIQAQPFNLIATLIFFCAIIHTFFAHKFAALAKRAGQKGEPFVSEMLHFFSEVEVVFGLWVIPLLFSMALYYDWSTALNYLDSRDYTEPTFVVVIMALAATKPIFRIAEDVVRYIANLGGGSASAWWLSILTLGPFLSSFITEPGAMTISAMLLSTQFYARGPSFRLKFATLGLLFTNISVGGIFTNFAAPPVLMVSKAWHWDTSFMMTHYGWKSAIGVVLANALYYAFFRSEFRFLDRQAKSATKERRKEDAVPLWISIVHLGFLAWMVVHSHYPVIFIGTFLLFLGFYKATSYYQDHLSLKTPILVGFFLAGLVVHGGLQAWWIAPILSSASQWMLMVASVVLTAFNDNAGITYLATLVPGFSDTMKYTVVAGAVTGGGLTVIANAPNPAGQAILGRYFPEGIAPHHLFLGAALPTLIVGVCLYFL